MPAGTSVSPKLTSDVTVNSLQLAAGATIDTNGFKLTALGNVDAGDTIVGNGVLIMAGQSVTLQGTVSNLEIDGTVTLAGDLHATGNVTLRGTLIPASHDIAIDGVLVASRVGVDSPVLAGAGTLVTAGVDVNGLVVSNMQFTVSGGPIVRFDGVNFQNYAPTETRLTIAHPGAALPFTFNELVFQGSEPTTGSYIVATDTAADGNVLTINLVNAVAFNGPAHTMTNGGAIVNWFGSSVADLAVTQSDSPDPVQTGGTLTYSITITNNGPDAATDVTLIDALPDGVTFVSATPDLAGATCNSAGGDVTCALGSFGPGFVGHVSIVVTAGGSADPISNVVVVTSSTPDPDFENNGAEESTTVTGGGGSPSSDVAVTVAHSPQNVVVGAPLTYTVTVTNNGPSTATNIVVTNTLPASVTFVSASDASCQHQNGVVTCSLGTLANGAQAIRTIQVTPNAAQPIAMTASVTANESDPTPANNSATDNTVVAAFGTCATPSFSGPRLFNTGINPSGVVTGDFNKDGRPDAAVGGENGLVALLLGDGAGGFGAPTQFAATNVWQLVAADFNGDTNLDLAVANGSAATVTLLFGNGAGGFPTITPVSVGVGANSMAARDLDGDGDLDLVVASNSGANIAVVLGNGNGTFGTPTLIAITPNGGDVAIEDFDGNGTLDIAVENHNASSLSVFSGNGNGTFGAAVPTTVGGVMEGLVSLGDVDGNGKPDLGVASRASLVAETARVLLLLNNGSGGFQAPIEILPPGAPTGATTGDFNGDAKIDLVVAMGDSGSVLALFGNGDGSFATPVSYVSSASQANVAAADLNGDGRVDLVGTSEDAKVLVLLNTCGNGASADVELTITGPATATAGDTLTYTVTATNHGPSVATGLVVTHVVPSGATFLDVDATGAPGASCSESAGTVNCALPSLAVSAQAVFTISERMFGGTRINRATVTANESDPAIANNTAAFTTNVTAVPLTFVVTNTNDSGAGSLRQAISDSNTNVGATNRIEFNVGSGGISIAPLSPLPIITVPVVIDGTTQPGFNAATAVPIVELNGASAGSTAGLQIAAGGSTVRGLVINRFGQAGIVISGSGNNTIAGNYIGTDAAGTLARPNAAGGLFIINSSTNTIADNVISGNTQNGILLTVSAPGATSGNVIKGNKIGTNAAGTLAIPNTQRGITVLGGANNNTIGGTAAADRNIISGNTQSGIFISATGNTVVGNYVGLNVTGAAALANANGISLGSGASNNTIGGTSAGARNVISGNTGDGVFINGSAAPYATGNKVQGNYIGLRPDGTAAIPNTLNGVEISFLNTTTAVLNTIGGTAAGAGNVISGNGINGVILVGPGTVVQGNWIGTNGAGTAAIGNGIGVQIRSATNATTSSNTIGGGVAGARNVISGNTQQGVLVITPTGVAVAPSGNLIQGNSIGLNAAGTGPLGNGSEGVSISIQSTGLPGPSGNTIGGTTAALGNIIQNNGTIGVRVAAGTANTIGSNSISSNGALGIDLGTTGVSGNDTGDGDSGANNLQNFPVLSSATSGGGSTTINGSLNSTAGTAFRIQFFASPGCDSSGNGEGQTFIGESTKTTDGTGNVSLSEAFGVSLPAGSVVTATATDPNGNTSEFSACVTVAAPPAVADVAVGVSHTPDPPVVGSPLTYTVTVTNNGPSPATNVVLTNTLPESVTFVSASDAACQLQGVTVTCPIGSLANGAQAVRTIQVTPTTAAPISMSAAVAADQSDSNTANNSATDNAVVAAFGTCAAATFSGPYFSAAGTPTISWLATGDFNGDNTVDAVVAAYNHGVLSFLPGNGAGGFGPAISVPAQVDQIVVRDFNHDGKLDVVGVNTGFGVQNNISVFLGNGQGGFASELTFAAGQEARDPLIADLNGDSNLDLVIDDFDGDSKPDIIVANSGTNTLSLVKGQGNGTFNAPVAITLPEVIDGLAPVGDVSGDGRADLIVGKPISDTSIEILLLVNDGNGGFAAPMQLFAAGAYSFGGAGDFNGDGKADIAVTNFGAGTLMVSFGHGDGTFAAPVSYVVGTTANFSVADANGDGRADVIGSAPDSGAIYAMLNTCGTGASTDVAISVTGPNTATAGDEVTFTTVATSLGPIAATGVVVTHALPHLDFESLDAPAGVSCTAHDESISCAVNSLAVNASATFTLHARALAGPNVYTASVTASESDPVPSNNTASATTTVAAAPVTFVVTNTNDAGAGSLRQAIVNSQKNEGSANRVEFSAGTGPISISLLSPLPGIGAPVVIDGTTQPGFDPQNPAPIVELNGTAVTNGAGLVIYGGGSTVRGLVINRFGFEGIFLSDNDGNVIQGNYIGTDLTGTLARGNGSSGISVGTSGNTIGGLTPALSNVISGNGTGANFVAGINIFGGSNNVVQGNRIGTNAAGTAALPNSDGGVSIFQSNNNTVGGTSSGARNIISGNGSFGHFAPGVNFGGSATGNLVQGNYIGTDVNGTSALANRNGGINIQGAPGNTIGGNTSAAMNVISGNGTSTTTGNGVTIGAGSGSTIVRGNRIGTNAAGTAALPNANSGIQIISSNNNSIGGTTSGAGNLISGNGAFGRTAHGINATGTSTGNQIQGNFIGINASGTSALANTGDGVLISSPTNTVGGTAAAARNIISGNQQRGVEFSGSGATGNLVQGNYIGTNVTGTSAIANGGYGVQISSSTNTVGGTVTGARNVLSGNGLSGINLTGTTATGNLVQGNYIGLNAAGTAAVANVGNGVFIQNSASGNTIGGTVTGAANVISGNGIFGVTITGTASVNNAVLGNSITGNGSVGIDLGGGGVTANDAGDGDTGPNNFQNFPVLSSVIGSGTVAISGSLNSTANTQFRIQFFANAACDSSGNGEGQAFIGETFVTTDASGNATFSPSFSTGGVANVITATATDPSGNTSEFSACRTAVGPTMFTVTNTSDVGAGSLRQAILDANANAGQTDTIVFNIAGSGTHTIAPTSSLPVITDPVVIDGTSQPGYSGTPLIELDGTNAGGSSNGLQITAGNSTVRGLAINRFGTGGSGNGGAGIVLQTAGNNLIEGNYIGVDATGSLARPNRTDGIWMDGPANIIGGTTAAARNMISGNGRIGIVVSAAAATGNQIRGNYIGLDAAGTAAVANQFHGLSINDSANNAIGGTTAGAGNVISGNGVNGIGIFGAASTQNVIEGNLIGTNAAGTGAIANALDGIGLVTGSNNRVGGTTAAARNVIAASGRIGVGIFNASANNVIQGNFIGTDVTGTINLGNVSHGAHVNTDAGGNNQIGGAAAGAGNVIAFNGGSGVSITATTGNSVLGNSLQSNSGLGIDLGPAGVTPNDLSDADTGPNDLQNFPVLTSAVTSTGSVSIDGTLNSTPSTNFTIEFFANTACDPSGNGEGAIFLGSAPTTTDGNGNAAFNVVLGASVAAGQFITATATDAANNTSEFSACTTVTAAGTGSADVSVSVSDAPDPVTAGQNVVYTFTITNNGPNPATNVLLIGGFDPGLTPISVNPPSCTVGAPCQMGTLANGAQTTVAFTMRADAEGPLAASGTVASALTDPNSGNNSAIQQTTVTVPANAVVVHVTETDPNASEIGPTPGVFTFSRNDGDLSSPLQVFFSVSGSASQGSDYVNFGGNSVTIPANELAVTLTVTPILDGLAESAESVVLTLNTNASYIVGSPGSAAVTIHDASESPLVSVEAVDSAASEIGPDVGVLRFTRSGSTASALTVSYNVGGTATNGADYSAIGTTIIIPAGQTAADLTITPALDATAEPAEAVVITLLDGADYDLGSPISAAVIIADAGNPCGPESGPMVNGATHCGTISNAGEIDTWTFTAAVGDRFAVHIGEVVDDNDFRPWIRVLAPNGSTVGSGSGLAAAQVGDVVATAAGTYQLLVASFDSGFDGTGTYRLTMTHTPGPITVSSGDQGGPLTNGAIHTGDIFKGDLDVWTFAANAGERIAVHIGQITDNDDFRPWIRLWAPNGASVGAASGTDAAEIGDVVAPVSGTYLVLVGSFDSGFDGTGTYRLTMTRTPGPITVSPGDEGGPLTNGATHTGEILNGDLDVWTFTANAGERIALNIGQVTDNNDFRPWIRLWAPDGTSVGAAAGTDAAEISDVVAPVTGDYAVLVASFDSGFDGTGTYRLTAMHTPGPFTVSPGDEGGPLANGAMHSGEIVKGDLDIWTFTANAGERIAVHIGQITDNDDFRPWIRLWAPNGTSLGAASGTDAAEIGDVVAPVTGDYAVLVASFDSGFDGTGTYRLTMTHTPGPITVSSGDDGGPLTNGAMHSGEILKGDLDVWTFTANAGDRLAVHIGQIVDNDDFRPWIRVWAPNGASVGAASGTDAAQIGDVVAPVTGDYLVLVGSFDSGFDGTGTYQLTMTHTPGPVTVSPGDEGGPLTNGTTTGAIVPGDLDVWTFTATAGDHITLAINQTSETNDFRPWIRLWTPTGASLASTSGLDTATISNVVAPTTGTYLVLVASFDSGFDGAGTYSLTLSGATGNQAPVANAGPDQSVNAGDTVQLNGSASSDPNNDPLTYAWSFSSKPAASAATLTNATTATPTFVADVPGTYVVQLIVNDGTTNSTADTVQIHTNAPPVANAGPDQTVPVGNLVQLDGSGSSDPEGSPLTYTWILNTRPAGSSAVLSPSNSIVNPAFVADLPGTYVAQLVVNDGLVNSASDIVIIHTANRAPLANAGPDQSNVAIGATVNLSGVTSSDPDGDPITYAWTFTLRPPASTAVLVNATTATPTFVVDRAGTYSVQLVVSDGQIASGPDEVNIVTVNQAPVANAGPDQTVMVDSTVGLNGNASSDPDGNPLTFSWTFTQKPSGSTATLSNATSVIPSFVPDLPGQYTVQLIVNDGVVNSAPDSVVITAQPNNIQLALVGTPLIGVSRQVPVQITLPSPAPAGGVAVTVSSDNTNVVTVGPPNTANIAQGATTAQLILNGIAVGSTTLHATAPGYNAGSLGVTVTQNVISSPASLNVALGQSTALPISIGPSVAPPGGLLLDVTSANPSVIEVITPQVLVPEGALSVNATVRGAAAGTAAVTVSRSGYASSTTTATSSADLDILQTSVSFSDGFASPQVTVELQNAGAAIAAPSNFVVTLASANTACVTVPASITIPAGQASAVFQPAYGGSAARPCTTTVTASAPSVTSDTVSVTVNAPPGISVGATATLGAGLELSQGASLGTSQHNGVTVTVTSSNPALVRVAPDGVTAGSGSMTANLTTAQTFVPFTIQALENVTGSAQVTISAPGFSSSTQTVTVVPSGIEIQGLTTSTTTLSADDTFYVQVGIPNGSNTALSTVQNVRAGGPQFVFTLVNGNASVGQLKSDQPVTAGQTVTKVIEPNFYYPQWVSPLGISPYGLAFDPTGAGTTTITVSGPPGMLTMSASGSRTVTVSAPSITVSPQATVGAGLELGQSASLGASQHGGVTVTVASNNAAVLVAKDGATAGAASFTVNLPNGQTGVSYYVQGVSIGSATVTVSAQGFTSGTETVNVVQSGIEIQGLPTSTTSLSTDDTFYVQVGLPNAQNTALSTVQNVRPGATPLVFTLTNSNASVAQLKSDEPAATGQSVTKPIQPNIYYPQWVSPGGISPYGLAFDPTGVGTTTISVTGPSGVLTMTTSGSRVVSVTGPSITVGSTATVGAGLQVGSSATLGASQHGGVTVTVSSNNGAVLVAKDATTAGTSSFTLDLLNGQTSVPFHVQGTGTGSATVTISAPGFSSATQTVTVVQSGIEIQGLPMSTTTLSTDDTFYVQVGIPNAGKTALSTVQNVRPGGSLAVTLTNSNGSVAQLKSDEPAATGQTVSKPIQSNYYYTQWVSPGGISPYGLAFDPIGNGSTTVSVSGPTGVLTMSTSGNRTVTVNTPTISLASTFTVGAGLQANTAATLGASQHGGVRVTVSSSAPSLARVSPDSVTPGPASGSFQIDLPNGSTSIPIYVQGMENTAGTAVVSVSAPGFTTATMSVTVKAIGVEILGVPTSTTTLSADDTFYVQVGLPNATNTQLSSVQNIRAGSPGFVVTLTNSNGSAARLKSDEPAATGQTVTKPIEPGAYYTQWVSPGGISPYGLAFDPIGIGTTSVAVTGPAGVTTMTSTGNRTVSVTGPGITAPGLQIVGASLQVTNSATLGASQHGGVTVTVTSNDPTKVLVGKDASTTATSSFTVDLANGQTSIPYHVAGKDGATGSASITVSAPGFSNGVQSVSVVQSALRIETLSTSIAATAANDEFYISVGLPNTFATDVQTVQNVAVGSSLAVTVTNGAPNIGAGQLVTLAGGAHSRTVTLPANQYYSPTTVATGGVAFDPLAAGSTLVEATIPGFITTDAGRVTVQVTGGAGAQSMTTQSTTTTKKKK